MLNAGFSYRSLNFSGNQFRRKYSTWKSYVCVVTICSFVLRFCRHRMDRPAVIGRCMGTWLVVVFLVTWIIKHLLCSVIVVRRVGADGARFALAWFHRYRICNAQCISHSRLGNIRLKWTNGSKNYLEENDRNFDHCGVHNLTLATKLYTSAFGTEILPTFFWS